MTPPSPTPDNPLVLEIAEDAADECRRMLESARSEAASSIALARDQASQEQERRLALARENASRETARMLATLPLEERRRRAARMESHLQTLRHRINEQLQLHASRQPRATALRLATEAIQAMEGNEFRIQCSSATLAGPESSFSTDLARNTGRPALVIQYQTDPSLAPGSVLVEDLPGRQRTDNRPLARLDRLWPELRRQIAQVQDVFTQPPPTAEPP